MPAPECSCGIHASTDLEDALNHANLDVDQWQAAGAVSLSGRILPGPSPRTWRAERADVVALFDISSMWQSEAWLARFPKPPEGMDPRSKLFEAWNRKVENYPAECAAKAADYRTVLAALASHYAVPVIVVNVDYQTRSFSVPAPFDRLTNARRSSGP